MCIFLTLFIPGGVFSKSGPVNCSEIQNETRHNLELGDFSQIGISKIWISLLRDNPFLVAMVTNLSRVAH